MEFEFNWQNKEANFGLPETKEIDGGTHFTIEMMLRHAGKFVMVRRPEGYPGHQLSPKAKDYPEGCLYFCHDLPRWGESLPEAVKRVVASQIGAEVQDIRILDLNMQTYPDDQHEGNRQWAITAYVAVELTGLPEINDKVTEVRVFDEASIPDDMGWWEQDELRDFISQFKEKF